LLYNATRLLPPESAILSAFKDVLLQSGLAPNDLFTQEREQSEVLEGLNYYVCEVEQPLDEKWRRFPGCLCGQEEWTSYLARWGVLAHDEEEATRQVMAAQQRCHPVAARLCRCEAADDGYRDAPGIIWQGIHVPVSEEPEMDE